MEKCSTNKLPQAIVPLSFPLLLDSISLLPLDTSLGNLGIRLIVVVGVQSKDGVVTGGASEVDLENLSELGHRDNSTRLVMAKANVVLDAGEDLRDDVRLCLVGLNRDDVPRLGVLGTNTKVDVACGVTLSAIDTCVKSRG